MITNSRPKGEWVRFREHVFGLFLNNAARHEMRRHVLGNLVAGDWQQRGDVQILVPGDCDESVVRQNVANILPYILVNSAPQVLNRARWAKWDEPISDVGLIEACHGLWSSCFPLWARFQSTGALPTAEEIDRMCSDDGFAAFARGFVGEFDHRRGGQEATMAPDDTTGKSVGGNAQDNDHSRSVEVRWCGCNPNGPFGVLVVMRAGGEPSRLRMATALFEGGAEFDDRELARLAELLCKGRRLDIGDPSFRLLSSALGRGAEEFRRSLQALGTPQAWGALPDDFWTLKLQTMAFKMVSAAGGAAWELVDRPRTGYPWRLFLVLDDPSFAETVLAEHARSKCLFDAWSDEFVQHYSEDLQRPTSLAFVELHVIAAMAKEDMSQIESLHAILRRYIVARSVQTQGIRLDELSCYFVSRILRNRNKMVDNWCGAEANAPGPVQPVASPRSGEGAIALPEAGGQAKRRHGAGGGWRAFLHERSWGVKADFKKLALEYLALSVQERARYRVEGAKGTVEARA